MYWTLSMVLGFVHTIRLRIGFGGLLSNEFEFFIPESFTGKFLAKVSFAASGLSKAYKTFLEDVGLTQNWAKVTIIEFCNV